jgi:anti-sigma-K factor RskA
MSNHNPNFGDSPTENPGGQSAHRSFDSVQDDSSMVKWPNVVSMHEHVGDLLGAYAVHSVNDAESELVELHLEHCVLCQSELAQHFETAARLGAASVIPVAPRVWDNVLSEIRLTKAISAPTESGNSLAEASKGNQWALGSTGAAQPHAPSSQQPHHLDSNVASSEAHLNNGNVRPKANGKVNNNSNSNGNSKLNGNGSSDGNRARTWRVAVAAAVTAAAISVPIVSRLSGSSFSLAAVAKHVAAQESSRSFTLKSEQGSELAQVVVGKDGQGYLTSDSLPKLDNGKAYQLWAVTTSGPVSVGVLGADPSVQAFATPQTYAALAISVEDAAGAATPTPPIASAAL